MWALVLDCVLNRSRMSPELLELITITSVTTDAVCVLCDGVIICAIRYNNLGLNFISTLSTLIPFYFPSFLLMLLPEQNSSFLPILIS